MKVINLINKTVCELFAGVGGFRVGLGDDWETVWANQWEPGKKQQHAFNCYIKHFGDKPEHVNEDIGTIDKTTIPDHNLLVGGFPCQDYSVAHTGATGIEGKKGVLWWDIRDVLIAKKPKFVLLENVDRLLKSPAKQRGRDFGVILACFNDLGYSVEWRVITASDYGFPQKRKRTFIFAYRNDTTYHSMIKHNNLEHVIHRSGFFYKYFPIDNTTIGRHEQFVYTDVFDVSDNFKFDFLNSGVMTNGIIYTENTISVTTPAKTLGSILETNVSDKYNAKDLDKWAYLKGNKRILRTTKEGFEYWYTEGAMAYPDYLDRPARTMLTSEGSLNRTSHILEDPETKNYRILTPIECERINGFPDNWTNTGMPERMRYFCMGNALVVGLITNMSYRLDEIFKLEQ